MNDRVVDLRDGQVSSPTVTSAVESETESLSDRVVALEGENAGLRLQLAVFAATDAVTGLANRIGLLDAIEMASYRLVRMKEPFAVVVSRFPQLSAIVDDDEHLEAIRDLAGVLAAGLRDVDRVGRLDPTTFVSVLANIPFEHVETVLGRSRASLQAVSCVTGAAENTIDTRLVALSMTDNGSPVIAEAVLQRCIELIDDTSAAEIQAFPE